MDVHITRGVSQVIKPIGVLITDDHPIMCAGLRIVVESAPDIVAIGEAVGSDEAVEKVCTLLDDDSYDRTDLVLMGLRSGEAPGATIRAGGVDATTTIRALAGYDIKAPGVLVVTNYSSDSDVLGAMIAGVVGYLLKDAAPEELVDGIRHIVRGETVLNTQVARRLMGRVCNPNTTLTPREFEVLELIAQGMSNRKTAEQLVLTEAAVKSYLAHIFTKLDVSPRIVVVARAQELGMLGEQEAG